MMAHTLRRRNLPLREALPTTNPLLMMWPIRKSVAGITRMRREGLYARERHENITMA